MEKLNMALLSTSSSPRLVGGYPTFFTCLHKPSPQFPSTAARDRSRIIHFSLRSYRIGPRSSRLSVSSLAHSPPGNSRRNGIVIRKLGVEQRFASVSSSSSEQQTSSVGISPPTLPSQSSNVGSPLFWVLVGVGLSAVFSWAATSFKKYAMQQAFKTMMKEMNTQNNQSSNSGFSPGSPFPFPMPSTPGPGNIPSYSTQSASGPALYTSPASGTSTATQDASQPAVTVDVSATKVESDPATDVKNEAEIVEEPKKYAFVDVSPEETLPKSSFERVEDTNDTSSSVDAQASQNGAASKQGPSASDGYQSSGSPLSVEALEKMLEDPTVQQIVYPYLPEEMRNPSTFKWMLQNPQYRQQLQDMLNNMKGSGEWDNRMMESLKNFDLNSPDVKQQFDQIGLTPEEVIKKVMANPDIAMAFQNPRVQQAIMECSQNPLSIAKYQNDKEVMDVFNKISELFPGASGSP
uniref:Protein TIC 40, chloroplastic n=2 Tax=Rhizophora mucronata TaxID=61149 RepID=A0A2P2JKX7_RHIMU